MGLLLYAYYFMSNPALLRRWAIKVGYEQIDGSSEQVANLIDAKVAVDAHLFGALTGIAVFLLMFITAKKNRN